LFPFNSAAPLVLVLGPTGSGKSGLAIRLALEFNGEIVNCDSQQVYRGLNIGTAKVPESERHGIPHHLIDIAEPDEVFSAGEYRRRARIALNDIRERGRLPIVCGGTGFYVRGLLDGLFEGPRRDDALRGDLNRREQKRPGFVHRLLRRVDTESAARIHPNDIQKAVRAVEVSLAARTPMTTLLGQSERPLEGFRWLKLGLDPQREALYARINSRCERMFGEGLVGETNGLLERGYGRETKALESIGYFQSIGLINGQLTLEEALADTQIKTRRYAKRQLTWFRRDTEIHWLAGFGDAPEIELEAIRLVNGHLHSTTGH
jgi:tRNA dimethylallyltransferase